MTGHFEHCMELLRAGDREHHLAVLYAPEDKRAALAALFAFSAETARIAELVSEPMPGEIRLQWWRDVISGEREGEGRQHPVASALIDAIVAHGLSPTAFDNLLEARIFDLYHDPMPDSATLEGYLGETHSALFQLAAQILNGGDDPRCADAAGHAGIAYGLADMLRATPWHRSRGQVFVPGDLLAAAGTEPAGWLSGANGEALGQVVTMVCAIGLDHLAKAEAAIGQLDRVLLPAFLPLAVAGPLFRKAEKRSVAAAANPVLINPMRTQWLLFRRACGF
jgi:phytoene synthase